MDDYFLDNPEHKSKFHYVFFEMFQTDKMGFNETKKKLKIWARDYDKCIEYGVYSDGLLLEFSEEILASDLRTLLSSFITA